MGGGHPGCVQPIGYVKECTFWFRARKEPEGSDLMRNAVFHRMSPRLFEKSPELTSSVMNRKQRKDFYYEFSCLKNDWMTNNFQQWMSWLPQRWRTQRNAIRNANCKTSWIIKILNAHCASILGACLFECQWISLSKAAESFWFSAVYWIICLGPWRKKKNLFFSCWGGFKKYRNVHWLNFLDNRPIW